MAKALTFFMVHLIFQSSLFNGHTPSLWEIESAFMKCLKVLLKFKKILKNITKNGGDLKLNNMDLGTSATAVQVHHSVQEIVSVSPNIPGRFPKKKN